MDQLFLLPFKSRCWHLKLCFLLFYFPR